MNNPKHKDIEFGTTVIVCKNVHELSYVLSWCGSMKKIISNHIKSRNKFPFYISVSGNIVGFVETDDRAMYYMSFDEFLTKSRLTNGEADTGKCVGE